MKGAIKTVKIKGANYDIKKEGASLAIECQSIFNTIVKNSGIDLDADLRNIDMISEMTIPIVSRIKHVLIHSIASPKITEESFEDIKPSVVPDLFVEVYNYQTKEADDKKKVPNDSTD